MNRKLTARERWFLTALPATMVLAVYGFGFHSPQQANLADAQRQLSAARQASVTPSQVAAKRQEARSLQDRLEAAKRELPGGSSKTQVRPLKGLLASDETRALAKITEVFKRQSVLVVASTRLSDSEARNAMPLALGEMAKNLSGPTAGMGGGVWRMEVIGSFDALRASLTAMEAMDALVVPLCVSMEPSEDGGSLHHWSLWLWM